MVIIHTIIHTIIDLFSINNLINKNLFFFNFALDPVEIFMDFDERWSLISHGVDYRLHFCSLAEADWPPWCSRKNRKRGAGSLLCDWWDGRSLSLRPLFLKFTNPKWAWSPCGNLLRWNNKPATADCRQSLLDNGGSDRNNFKPLGF